MTLFDAINISMCAVPTGGFATHGESIAYWNSPVIEAITIVLMVAGGTNFLLLFLLLRGKLKAFLTHIETPLYFGHHRRHGPGGGRFLPRPGRQRRRSRGAAPGHVPGSCRS